MSEEDTMQHRFDDGNGTTVEITAPVTNDLGTKDKCFTLVEAPGLRVRVTTHRSGRHGRDSLRYQDGAGRAGGAPRLALRCPIRPQPGHRVMLDRPRQTESQVKALIAFLTCVL
jgi:hypothetical protein